MLVHVSGDCNSVRAAIQMRSAADLLWLDSADPNHPASQYSYLCFDAISKLTYDGDTVRIDGQPHASEPLQALRDWIASFAAPHDPNGPPFQGGTAGYLSYDFAPACIPQFKSRHPAKGHLLELFLYDTLIAFDHKADRTSVISAGLIGPHSGPDPDLAASRIGRVLARLAEPVSDHAAAPSTPAWTTSDTAETYATAITKTQAYIRAGDIYQANIAQTYQADCPGRDAFAHYLTLREASPAPFSAFGRFQTRTLASVSPERLIAGTAVGEIKAQPIKGTIRSADIASEDARLRQQLQTSRKDRAENIMIVDLLRNDLSKVCAPRSVKTPSLCQLETFAGLHHLTSTVTGRLRAEHDSIDVLAAVFPGGSITGAPKLRAMEIIDELETSARGAFCGSLGYIGFDGAMDFSILIRTIDIVGDTWTLKAGAGITLLSDPVAEHAETVLKVSRLTESHSSVETAPL
ncbi:MAG: anthranilate synthase component I family protein [Henriciella sp.]|nr:anthranilate synthase component I family protein [Henriciella sp.]